MILTLSCFGQFSGDVTGDNIIDATDYVELQDIIAGKKNHTFISDINKDGETNIADLLIIENYIYREGHAPEHSSKKQVKTQIYVTPGFVDTEQKTIEIVLQNGNPIAGFQLDFIGINKIVGIDGGLLESSGMKLSFFESRVFATLDNGNEIQAGNNVLFKLKFEGDFEEICIARPVFVNGLAEPYSAQVGQCANGVYTKEGCETLKEIILGNEQQDKYSDVNKDGYVDVSDLMIVENFIYRNGPAPPGIIEETKGKVKLQFDKVDNQEKMFQVNISNKKAIASFQLTIEGISGIQVTEGLVGENDLKLHIRGNRLIAFLEEGSPIPPGNGMLLNIKYSDTISSEVCFYDPLFISSSGNKYAIQLGECKSLVPIVLGCMDTVALNYNSQANKGDGTCEYPKPQKKPPKVEKPKKTKPVNVDELLVADIEKRKKDNKTKNNKKNKQKPKQSVESKIGEIGISKNAGNSDKLKVKKKREKSKKNKTAGDKESIKEIMKEETKKTIKDIKPSNTDTDITDIDEAVLVPKLSALERINVPNPKKGMMVYDTDANAFIYYDGKSWRIVGASDKQVTGFDVKRKGKNWKNVKSNE